MARRKSSRKSLKQSPRSSKSPTGVADVFVRLDDDVIKKDLNNSFSWAATSSAPSGDVRSQIEEAKKRLQWLKEQSVRDKEEYQDRLREAKAEFREEMRKKHEALASKGNAKESQQARLVLESEKIIEYIRESNAKLRREIATHKRLIQQMNHDNAKLVEANKLAATSFDELSKYVKTQTKTNQKLNENCEVYKSQLRKMKDEHTKRMAYFKCEASMERSYEKYLAKVLSNVKLRSRDPDLIESVYVIAEEGVTQAGENRDTHLQKSGLAREQKPGAPQFSIFDSPEDSGSDSDSDSED